MDCTVVVPFQGIFAPLNLTLVASVIDRSLYSETVNSQASYLRHCVSRVYVMVTVGPEIDKKLSMHWSYLGNC